MNNANEKLLEKESPSFKAIIEHMKKIIEKQILDSFKISIIPIEERNLNKDEYGVILDYEFNDTFSTEVIKPFHLCAKIVANFKDTKSWDNLFNNYQLKVS